MVVLSNVCIILLAVLFVCANAMYSSKSDVVQATDKTFKDEVLNHDGVVIVEFYAPWCGHCKTLTPEYDKAATILKGVVKVVAVDATVEKSLANKYSIQGFPALKVFGSNKRKPTDYQGERTADAIITETMKATNQLVKSRKFAGTEEKAKTEASGKPKPQAEKKSNGGSSSVIELTDLNFNALVTDSSTDIWLIEFFAPWCGHCKALAPEWEEAASKLKGIVKLGAVDATVHKELASRFGISGYPSIKVFIPGRKDPKDYKGAREASGIVDYALNLVDKVDIPLPMPQVVSKGTYNDVCDKEGKICVLMFVPHILDTGASGRNEYLAAFQSLIKGYKGKPFTFGWLEGGSQSELENVLNVNAVYPSISVLSNDKGMFATMKVSWSKKNYEAFLDGVLTGAERTSKMLSAPTLAKAVLWDGKDAVLEKEEFSLDDILSD